jgi:hypothetical protein
MAETPFSGNLFGQRRDDVSWVEERLRALVLRAVSAEARLTALEVVQPACRVYRDVTQAIADATPTVVVFNAEAYDTATMHDNVTLSSRITVPTAGIYDIRALVQFATNGTGERYVYIRRNGTEQFGYVSASPAQVIDDVGLATAMDYKLAANDYIEVVVYQNSGGPLNITTGASNNNTPLFSARRVGAG